MFIGEYSNKIDDKGRLAIPSKFRSDLASGAIVTRGLDGCLFVYTKPEWDKLAERLTTLPLTAANARAFARHMLAGAMDVEIDKQGRINLPGYLRQFATLKNQVVVAGLFNRLEIWDEAAWRLYQEKTEADSTQIAEQLLF
jgi:MraZ protein